MLKNIDDFCVFGKTLKDLEIQIEKLAKLCRRINLKLAPSKFSLSTAVKFGGTIISAEKIEENSVIFLDPPDSRILAVTEMEKPKTKKDVQKLCGMISSLKPWFPSINFSTDALRKGCAHTLKFIWTPEMELEFEKVKIANSAGIGFCFYQNIYLPIRVKWGKPNFISEN